MMYPTTATFQDVEAYKRGEFQMYVAEVVATWNGISESDILGGIAAADVAQITEAMEEHDMVGEALRALETRLETVKKKFESEK